MNLPDESLLGRELGLGASSGDLEPGLAARIGRLMHEQPFGVLCTQGQTQPYGSLVAFACSADLDAVAFATLVTTRKYRLLSACRRVALLVDSRSSHPGDMLQIEAVTATGEAVELDGDAAASWTAALGARHPNLKGFVAAPTCAVFRVDITRYFHVARFQEVRQWVPPAAG